MATRNDDLYETDFYAWTQAQAKALRNLQKDRWNGPLDLPRLAEEVEDLGKEQRNALRSWTTRIIEHLLKLQFSPATEPRRGEVREILQFRREVRDRITPALRRDLASRLPHLYRTAREDIDRELRLFGEEVERRGLPEECHYTLAQVLDSDWCPER